jgi:hypothetical protein
MPDTLTITGNRTGRTYELPIQDGTIHADQLRPRPVYLGADVRDYVPMARR